MQHLARSAISQHSLARLKTWAGLWLQWFASVVFTWIDEHTARALLKSHGRTIGYLVFMHACARVLPKARGRFTPHHMRRRVSPSGVLRAWMGPELRRALRGRDVVSHFFALLTAMRDFESLVARMIKRLKRGLTRLGGKTPKREPKGARVFRPASSHAVVSALAPACYADTS
jgi:hypothetical protein